MSAWDDSAIDREWAKTGREPLSPELRQFMGTMARLGSEEWDDGFAEGCKFAVAVIRKMLPHAPMNEIETWMRDAQAQAPWKQPR